MKSLRFAAAIASVGISLAVPAGALAAGSATTPSSQITPTAPSRLTAPATSTTPATPTPATATSQGGPLPDTGYDLLPETVLGLTLVGAGVGLRLRLARGSRG